MATDRGAHKPKLVVRNTFLELSDDHGGDGGSPKATPARPRAHTDMTHGQGTAKVEREDYFNGHPQMPGYGQFHMPEGGFPMPEGKGGGGPFGMGDAMAAGWDPMAAAWWMHNSAAFGAYGYPPPQGIPPYGFPPYFDPNVLAAQGFQHGGQRDRKASGGKGRGERKSPLGNTGANTAHSAGASSMERVAPQAGAAVANGVSSGSATTVMLRNIPNRYSQAMLVTLVEEQSFKHKFDFIYLPMDFRNGVNLGYAFVNLVSNEDALRLTQLFQGFSGWSCDSAKICEVSWAHPHQGLEEHVERYRNSPVMHNCMPEEYKPMIFKNGEQIPFPPPTKPIRAPKLRPARERNSMSGDGQ